MKITISGDIMKTKESFYLLFPMDKKATEQATEQAENKESQAVTVPE